MGGCSSSEAYKPQRYGSGLRRRRLKSTTRRTFELRPYTAARPSVRPFAPPGDPPPDNMTPGQTGTWNNQRQPENQWVLHPAIDGCSSAPPPPHHPGKEDKPWTSSNVCSAYRLTVAMARLRHSI